MPSRPLEEVSWHGLHVAEVQDRLGTTLEHGLTREEAEIRRAEHGPNVIREAPPRSPWRMLAAQFADFMILVLIGAAVIAGALGEPEDTVAIFAIVILNAVIGFVQEYRAERAMAMLKKLAAHQARVLRNGEIVTVPTLELVPGDVVLIEAGNIVPADLRVSEAAQLRIDESALTGESVAVEKHPVRLEKTDLALGDRINMAYKGTLVTYGRGRGIVAATGMRTELGRIAALLEERTVIKTPLQKRLTQFGKHLAAAALAICAVVFVAGLQRGEPLVRMFLTSVSLAVAAIPEALPALVTITLALGARRMLRVNALVRRLPAVETLGSVTYICTDKTGTLTENRMRLEEIMGAAGEPGEELYTALALSNDAYQAPGGEVTGDPTEVALLDGALAAGFDKSVLERRMPRVAEFPFDSERKRMTTFHTSGSGMVAFTKGAPEAVVPHCRDCDQAAILAKAAEMAARGLRVLAVASRRWPEDGIPPSAAEAEDALRFLGLAGLIDPPRAEAFESVKVAREAGITPVMITGDHPSTAQAIARQLGIAAEGDRVLTGPELAAMSQEELEDRALRIRVYARVDAAQKLRIVQALQTRGQFVAMTGDGVNDAPALQRADIGVAMGRGGTDVAREASGLVLLDDNFATIVAAVREGRHIFDNIRKFVKFILTSNSAEIWTIFLAPFLGLPVPLLPIHILWTNLVTDGLPGLALAAEPADRNIMRRPPRSPSESLFAEGLWQHAVWVGILMAAVSIFTEAYTIRNGLPHWQTMVFTVLTISQMAHVMAIRSNTESLFRQGVVSNLPLAGAVALTVLLQLGAIYLPPLQRIFKTAALSAGELAFTAALCSTVFIAVEIEKWFKRRRFRGLAAQ
jgi:Ca2+-transporting ATPase